jgi:hypothetical protein
MALEPETAALLAARPSRPVTCLNICAAQKFVKKNVAVQKDGKNRQKL